MKVTVTLGLNFPPALQETQSLRLPHNPAVFLAVQIMDALDWGNLQTIRADRSPNNFAVALMAPNLPPEVVRIRSADAHFRDEAVFDRQVFLDGLRSTT